MESTERSTWLGPDEVDELSTIMKATNEIPFELLSLSSEVFDGNGERVGRIKWINSEACFFPYGDGGENS